MQLPSFPRPLTLGLLLMPLWLAACVSAPPTPPAPPPPPPPRPVVRPIEAEPPAPATQPAITVAANHNGPLTAVLGYADRVRSLNGTELNAEIARLGDPGDSPLAQMQLALALAQTRSSPDLARAAGLMQRVAAAPALKPEMQPLQGLARLLAARYLDQRRVEDERDRQAQLARDSQRRLDLLNERIEALRAIERSFGRPPAPPPPSVVPVPGTKPAP